MTRLFLASGALFAFAAVLTRALAAHNLKLQLKATNMLDQFCLASDYLLLHGLALLAVALLYRVQPHRCFSLAGWTLLTGSLLFSGSMFIKCWASIGAIGILTPVGGTLLLLGWLVLACGVVLARI